MHNIVFITVQSVKTSSSSDCAYKEMYLNALKRSHNLAI